MKNTYKFLYFWDILRWRPNSLFQVIIGAWKRNQPTFVSQRRTFFKGFTKRKNKLLPNKEATSYNDQ